MESSNSEIVTCVLNGEEIQLPKILFQDDEIFRSVVSFNTWQNLSIQDRSHLQKFLPPFCLNSSRRQDEIVRLLFSGERQYKHGNAVDILRRKMKAGLLSPEVVKQWKHCHKLKYKNYKLKQKERYKALLQEILVSRQRILDQIKRHGPGQPIKTPRPVVSREASSIDEKVKKRYEKIVKDVKTDCKDTYPSSDEDEGHENYFVSPSPFMLPGYYPSPQYRTRGTPYADVRSLNYRSAGMPYYPPPPYYYPSQLPASTVSQPANQISEEEYKQILEKHRKRRICNETHPDLDVMDINLADIIMRANPVKKVANKNNKKLKKGKKTEKRKKPQAQEDAKPTNMSPTKSAKQSSQETNNEKHIKDEPMETGPPQGKESPREQDIEPTSTYEGTDPNCFFSLLKNLFFEEQNLFSSVQYLEQKVGAWLSSQQDDGSSWISMHHDWANLAFPALRYLSGDGRANLLADFVPLVSHNEQKNEWKWTGAGHDGDSILLPLCQHWMDTLRQQLEEEIESQESQESSRTEYVVRPSTEHEKIVFRHQERRRYENPHRPFVFTMHGFESTVGPVKGVFNKETGFSKAREHVLLVSSRPAYVTILCLVRDAVARLPNGEGTRAEVCQLLKDSQFINSQASDNQVHAVVSGALDRLHAEKDPCVKYDISRKVWIYLHKCRSYEEFERIHGASAAAARAKKQFAQKQKSNKQKKVFQDLVDLHEQLAAKNTPTPTTSPSANPPKKKKKSSHHSSSPNTGKSPKIDTPPDSGQVHSSPNTQQQSSSTGQSDLHRQGPFTSPYHHYGIPKGVTESSPQGVVPLKITLPRGSIGSISPSAIQLQHSAEQNLSMKSGPLGSNQRLLVYPYPPSSSHTKDDSDSSS